MMFLALTVGKDVVVAVLLILVLVHVYIWVFGDVSENGEDGDSDIEE
jgi:hypothetical protein